MFRIDMLPAAQGDCLWIEYGAENAPHRVLVDGGTNNKANYSVLRSRIVALPEGGRHFELVVVSHIDIDHIDGIVKLLNDTELGVTYDDLWFNGYQHLVKEIETLGGRSGELLTNVIDPKRWNKAFNGKGVVARGKRLPTATLAGGMRLTVLSPRREQLVALAPKWKKEAKAAGLDPKVKATARRSRPGVEVLGGTPNVEQLAQAKYERDTAEANGSSIALLAEVGRTKALLLADAFAEVVTLALDQLVGAGRPIKVAAVKLAHHGSQANNPIDLISRLDAEKWLVSTNGKVFQHPDPEAIARIVKHGPDGAELVFSHRTEFNDIWDSNTLRKRYRYATRYPEGLPIRVELS